MNTDNNVLLKVNNLTTYIKSFKGMVKCCENVGFELCKQEVLGIVGESGSGKTITAHSILGLINKKQGIIKGEVHYKLDNGFNVNLLETLKNQCSIKEGNGKIFIDKNISSFNKEVEKRYKFIRGNHISLIFQDPQTSLNPYWRIGKLFYEVIKKRLIYELYTKENNTNDEDYESQKLLGINHFRKGEKQKALEIFRRLSKVNEDCHCFYLIIRNKKKQLKKIIRKKSINWLQRVCISSPDEVIDYFPYSLSGGMCQRVMIALALASHPKILIADEPTTGLDVTIQTEIIELFKEIKQKYNLSIILISHDLGFISTLSDKVTVMYNGKILEYGKKEDILSTNNSIHPYTSGLINALPRYETFAMRKSKKLKVIKGEVPDPINPPTGCRFHPRCNAIFKNRKCIKEEPELFNIGKNHLIRCWLFNNN